MNVLRHLVDVNYFPLKIFWFDISITRLVLNLWLVNAVIILIVFFTARRAKLVPGLWQTFVELIIEFIQKNVVGILGQDAERFFPFIFTLFSIIFVSNLIGLLPGFLPPTSNINVTATWALIVFFVTHYEGIKRFGFWGYLRSFVPSNFPWFIKIFIIPIEIISQLARPFSLAVRLFANLFAGHVVSLVFISLIFIFKNYLIAFFPIIGNVLLSIFEIFVAFIQAFVFTFLATIYLSSSIKQEH